MKPIKINMPSPPSLESQIIFSERVTTKLLKNAGKKHLMVASFHHQPKDNMTDSEKGMWIEGFLSGCGVPRSIRHTVVLVDRKIGIDVAKSLWLKELKKSDKPIRFNFLV